MRPVSGTKPCVVFSFDRKPTVEDLEPDNDYSELDLLLACSACALYPTANAKNFLDWIAKASRNDLCWKFWWTSTWWKATNSNAKNCLSALRNPRTNNSPLTSCQYANGQR